MPAYLLWLALGSFAIGTESYMIGGTLPTIAMDLGIPPSLTGQLVTVFALVFGVGAPVMGALTARIERTRVILATIFLFGLGNIWAASAHSFAILIAARVLMALAAATFLPAATAFASARIADGRHGRAVSVIHGGLSIAMVLGAPLGTMVTDLSRWQTPFIGLGLLSFLMIPAIWISFPRVLGVPAGHPGRKFSSLFAPSILAALVSTALHACGAWLTYTYLAFFMKQTIGAEASQISLMLVVIGATSIVGTFFGGYAADRWNKRTVAAIALFGLAASFLLLCVSGWWPTPSLRWTSAVLAIGLWGVFGWMFGPAQQARLIGFSPSTASVTLSFNLSAVYFGTAVGAGSGALALTLLPIVTLPLLSAGCLLGAAIVLLAAPCLNPVRTLLKEKSKDILSVEASPCSPPHLTTR